MTPSGAVERRSLWRQHRWKLLLSLLLGLAFYWPLHAGGLPVLPDLAQPINGWAVAGYVLCWTVVHALRSARWYFLLAPLARVPLLRVISVASVGFGALVVLPLRTGELVRPLLITRRARLSPWAASGSVAAERVIDGLILSVILFSALQLTTPLSPLPDHIGQLPVPASLVPRLAYAALAMFAAVFAMMGAFYWRRRWVLRAIEVVLGVFSRRFAAWVAARVTDVASGLQFLPKLRYLVPFLLLTLAYWASNAFGSWFLAQSLGLNRIGYSEACVLMGVLALGILAPSAPGFFGSFQISVYAGLALYLAPDQVVGAGSIFVFALYAVQVGVTLLAAGIALIFEHSAASDGEILPGSSPS